MQFNVLQDEEDDDNEHSKSALVVSWFTVPRLTHNI
jgi:hypothetical protein